MLRFLFQIAILGALIYGCFHFLGEIFSSEPQYTEVNGVMVQKGYYVFKPKDPPPPKDKNEPIPIYYPTNSQSNEPYKAVRKIVPVNKRSKTDAIKVIHETGHIIAFLRGCKSNNIIPKITEINLKGNDDADGWISYQSFSNVKQELIMYLSGYAAEFAYDNRNKAFTPNDVYAHFNYLKKNFYETGSDISACYKLRTTEDDIRKVFQSEVYYYAKNIDYLLWVAQQIPPKAVWGMRQSTAFIQSLNF